MIYTSLKVVGKVERVLFCGVCSCAWSECRPSCTDDGCFSLSSTRLCQLHSKTTLHHWL